MEEMGLGLRQGLGEGEARTLKSAKEEKQNRFLGNETASNKEQPDVIRV